jgi:hypothetical protein
LRKKTRKTPQNYDGTGLTSHQLRDILPLVLRSVEGVYYTKAERILDAWPSIIGSRLSSMTRAESFFDGVLTVRVKNSTLHSLLQQHDKSRLLAKLRKQFPGIYLKTIVFRIG